MTTRHPRKPAFVTIAALDGLITAYYRPWSDSMTYAAYSVPQLADKCPQLAEWDARGVPCFDLRRLDDTHPVVKLLDHLPRSGDRNEWRVFVARVRQVAPLWVPGVGPTTPAA